jgi:hypothetical protein
VDVSGVPRLKHQKHALAFQEIVSWKVEAPLALGKETLAPT